MFPPRPPARYRSALARPPTGTGALSLGGLPPEQGGAGLIADDFTPRGFWARITSRPFATNAYGYARCDDTDPKTVQGSTPFPIMPQEDDDQEGDEFAPAGPWRGDGDALAAYEVNGRTDVPSDGSVVVWLEPLAGGVPGYGFAYTASAITAGQTPADPAGHYLITVDDEWQDASAPTSPNQRLQTLELPGPGTYLLYGTVLINWQALNGTSSGTTTGVAVRAFDATADVAVPGSMGALSGLVPAGGAVDLVGNHTFVATYSVTDDGPHTIRWEALRRSGVTWTLAQVGAISGPPWSDEPSASRLGFVKLG